MVIITKEPLDPWKAIAAFQQKQAWSGQFGATATFVGTMRDYNQGDLVQSMILEHHPTMTQKYLESLITQTNTAFELLGSLVVHRIGEINPTDPIVLVACWSVHRAAAFDACRQIMEKLKSEAPFWKKEYLEKGCRWVEKNTSG